MNNLSTKSCIPCNGDMKPMEQDEVINFKNLLTEGWLVQDNKKLHKEFQFKHFLGAMAFANQIAVIAENENHHPDICISYKKVMVELTTHVINGLSENDFILAAKIDGI